MGLSGAATERHSSEAAAGRPSKCVGWRIVVVRAAGEGSGGSIASADIMF